MTTQIGWASRGGDCPVLCVTGRAVIGQPAAGILSPEWMMSALRMGLQLFVSSAADRRSCRLHRDLSGSFRVEPICQTLEIAPSIYCSARERPACARAIHDRELREHIARVFEENYGVYGTRKVRRHLNREGIRVARCSVERLMRQMGLCGRVRGRRRRTTIPDWRASERPDLVERATLR